MVNGPEGQRLRILAGPVMALRAVCTITPQARVYATCRNAGAYVLPLNDEVHEALHRVNGTGEWLELGSGNFTPLLTTTDGACFQRASRGTVLAWLETSHGKDGLWQIAAVWIDGVVSMAPNLLRAGDNRPRSLQPVNIALRLAGGLALDGSDEFASLGLDQYASNEDLAQRAVPIHV